MDNSYKKLRRKQRKQAKSGKTYNSAYESNLKKQGYTIVKSSANNTGQRKYDIIKDGTRSSIIRSDNPDPEGKSPKMRVVKRAPSMKPSGKMSKRKYRNKII